MLPSLCRKGTCGACYAVVDGGRVQGQGPPLAPGRDPVPCFCRTFPRGTVAGHARVRGLSDHPWRDPAARGRGGGAGPGQPQQPARLLRLRLDPDEVSGAGVEFKRGRVELQVQTVGRAAYSLANTANWDGEVELLIRLQPGGAFSKLAGAGRTAPARPARSVRPAGERHAAALVRGGRDRPGAGWCRCCGGWASGATRSRSGGGVDGEACPRSRRCPGLAQALTCRTRGSPPLASGRRLAGTGRTPVDERPGTSPKPAAGSTSRTGPVRVQPALVDAAAGRRSRRGAACRTRPRRTHARLRSARPAEPRGHRLAVAAGSRADWMTWSPTLPGTAGR